VSSRTKDDAGTPSFDQEVCVATVTVLHPGAMGAAVAAQASQSGHQVFWVPVHRSSATQERACAAGLIACPSLAEALDASEVVLSICPPQAAEGIAVSVARHGFTGLYVEANAISPQNMERIANEIRPAPSVLDGAIIGPPPGQQRTCRLYLAGDPRAVDVLRVIFQGTRVQVKTAGDRIAAASALKMSFAAFQKAARTLAAVSHALADSHHVADLLTAEAQRMPSDFLSGPGHLPSVAGRAWRWAPEMLEVAETLRACGLPPQMAEAAAAVMERWEKDKDRYDLPLTEVLTHLRDASHVS
jgi:3-hydroxyisobutyrate dehydrogenase-like beta-hydroxyacid dehydrogenase